jgi:hypothetical protein
VPPPEPAAVEWRFDPWSESAPRAAAAAVAAFALAAMAAAARPGALVLLVAVLAVAGALAPGFLPTRCRVDARGVAWRTGGLPWSLRPWARVRGGVVGRRVVRFDAPGAGALARLRAVALPLPAARPLGGDLEQRLAAWLARHAG